MLLLLINGCCANDKGQLYKTAFKLHIVKKDTGEKVLELQSHEHQEIGKNKRSDRRV